MSEIKPCRICSTDEKDVMPILIYQGSPVFWRCLECETATTARFTQKEIDAAWNDLQDRIAAKIESECAAARKDERETVIDKFLWAIERTEPWLRYGTERGEEVWCLQYDDIRAVAEEVKAKL